MRNHQPTEPDQALTETVRRLYVRPVDPDRARRNVATIAEAARAADLNRGPAVSVPAASPARRRRVPLWRPALAAAAALVAVPGGMAAAGVEIPAPFDAPYRAVGITLPNQGEQARENRSPRVEQTPAATTPAATTPRTTTSQATPDAPAAATRAERKARKQRAERRRRVAQRRAEQRRERNRGATPATPATPAQPQPGGRAQPATPATPAQPARPQERSATTQPGRGPKPRIRQPRTAPGGKGQGLGRITTTE